MIKQIVHTAIFCFIVLTTNYSLTAQINSELLLTLTRATTTEMNAISNVREGSLLYNTTEKNVFQYNGSTWEKLNSSSADEKWTISGNDLYSSVSGNIGIGVTNPSEKLDVNGIIQVGNTGATTGTVQMIGKYSGINHLNTYGSERGTGATVIGYAVQPKSGAAGYVSSAQNVAFARGLLKNNGDLQFLTAPSAIVNVGADTPLTTRFTVKNGGNVGIGTTDPSAKLDVNGRGRIRSIPTGTETDKILTADTDGNIRKIDAPITNKSYVQTFKGSKSFGSGNAVLLNLFPQVTIQAGKKVKIDLYVPTRDNTNSWGGLYVNINARVNGTWYNLGNTGYDGGVMHYSSQSIHALNHEMLLDFITNLNLPDDQPYTLQFELRARSYGGTTYVNRSHDINRTANNLGSRGALQAWASDQNYCHIIIEEKDR